MPLLFSDAGGRLLCRLLHHSKKRQYVIGVLGVPAKIVNAAKRSNPIPDCEPASIFEMAQAPSSVRMIRKQRAKPSEALTRELLKSLVAAEAAWRTSPATIQAWALTPLCTLALL